MASTASITFNDFDGQAGVVGFTTAEVTGANFSTITSQVEALETALGNTILLGLAVQNQINSIRRKASANQKSGSPVAQRGDKWFVSYRDTTQFLDAPTNTIINNGYLKSFSLELPTANLALRAANSDVIYTQLGGGLTQAVNDLVTALDAVVRSPYGGEIQVEEIYSVSRAGG